MASMLPPELDNDSLASSPRSEYNNQPRVRFICTFGGRILPRPPDNQLCYVGGDNRMVAVHRHTNFASLCSKLAKLYGKSNISVKYQLPNEDLDALISVSTDEDVENMIEEYDRVAQNQNPHSSRLRLFLFTKNIAGEEEDNDSSVNREQWFLGALNLGSNGRRIDRVRSEVSSIISEVPDYLFGFDETAPSSDPVAKIRREVATLSAPGSPRRDVHVPSPYGSTSSAPVIRSSTPEIPPVKTKPEIREPVLTPQPEQLIQQWQYAPGPQVHYQNPVYYVPGSVQPVQMSGQYVQQYHQVPMGYHNQPQPQQIPGPGQVYGGTVRPVMMAVNGDNRTAYYEMKAPGPVQMYHHQPGMVVPGIDESKPDNPGRAS